MGAAASSRQHRDLQPLLGGWSDLALPVLAASFPTPLQWVAKNIQGDKHQLRYHLHKPGITVMNLERDSAKLAPTSLQNPG